MQRVGIFPTCLLKRRDKRLGDISRELFDHMGIPAQVFAPPPCCGWVPYTRGDWPRAREEARDWLQRAHSFDAVVIPSPSCVQFVRHYMSQLFAGDDPVQEMWEHVRSHTHELARYLDLIGYRPSREPLRGRCVLIPPCVSPHLPGVAESALALLQAIPDLDVHMLPRHRCCSWGGAFHQDMPELSRAMMETVMHSVQEAAPDFAVVLDPGCQPLLARVGQNVPIYHLAEVLAGHRP